MKQIVINGLVFLGMLVIVDAASAAAIDLTNWSQEGPLSNGEWTVSSDGYSVTQTLNSNPTYFVSDSSFINQEFNGSFEVLTQSDDDYIGFVFGWNSIDDYYLFDWKQADQTYDPWGTAEEGFTVSHITGGVASDAELWTHTGSYVQVLDSLYSPTMGWEDQTSYDFNLNYTELGFTISIDGNLIFAETGTFSAGNFGFYNFSQSDVLYEGFENSGSDIDPIPEPATVFLLGTGLIGLAGFRKKKH